MGTTKISRYWRRISLAFAAASLSLAPAYAQIENVDPNDMLVIDGPAAPDGPAQPQLPVDNSAPADAGPAYPEYPEDNTLPPIGTDTAPGSPADADPAPSDPAADNPAAEPPLPTRNQTTYQEDDLIGAAEGVFGKGAEGLGKLIQNILKKQGEPNGYIVGREAGGAFIFGLRYGSGTLFHKVEGQLPAYWTGPSVGFDAGGNAGSTFVLVYNLYDSEDLYKRFASAEGVAYLVGGFNASYLRRGDVVLIPIRVGAGLRLGANVGYMKMSKKRRWLPF